MLNTHVEQVDTREVVNITELNAKIDRLVISSDVFSEIDAIIAEIEGEQK